MKLIFVDESWEDYQYWQEQTLQDTLEWWRRETAESLASA